MDGELCWKLVERISGAFTIFQKRINKSSHLWFTDFMDRIQAVLLFIRIVDLGSFSKAAADMGIGQPAATKQIAAMEAQLGARLLHRSTHGVSPTEVGALYYEKCKLIAHHVEDAQSIVSLLQSQMHGALRISTSLAFGRRVLAPLVMQFMRLNPALKIDLNFDDRYVDLVAHGVDLAIRMGTLTDSTLGANFLGMNPWVVVASPEYLLAHGSPDVPSDLSAHAALIYSTVQGDDRWQFSGAPLRSGTQELKTTQEPKARQELKATQSLPIVVAVKGRLRSNNLSALLSAARGGMGIAALPAYVAHESIQTGAVVQLLASWSLPSQAIHAVFPSPRLVPTKVSGFVSWLHGQFDERWWVKAK